jgi:hypothetical protein
MFPEFVKHYDQHAKWAKELFTKYPTTTHISRMHKETLLNILRIKGDCSKAAEHIQTLTKETIGKLSSTNEILLTAALNDIKHYNSAICAVSKNMVNTIFKILQTREIFSYNY